MRVTASTHALYGDVKNVNFTTIHNIDVFSNFQKLTTLFPCKFEWSNKFHKRCKIPKDLIEKEETKTYKNLHYFFLLFILVTQKVRFHNGFAKPKIQICIFLWDVWYQGFYTYKPTKRPQISNQAIAWFIQFLVSSRKNQASSNGKNQQKSTNSNIFQDTILWLVAFIE